MTCLNHSCHLDQAIAKFWVGHYNEDLARVRKGGIDFPKVKSTSLAMTRPSFASHAVRISTAPTCFASGVKQISTKNAV
eukprot:COSAG05_NODE_18_length_34957_cov_44.338115_10_plen_79_part_00